MFERTHAGTLAQEVDRLAADPRVHRIFQWFSRHERELADFQLAITAVPAPSFAEHARAEWLCRKLQSLGLPVSTDAAGNLLAARPGRQSDSAAITVSAHLDTVFAAGTSLDVHREHSRLFGPGISDNGSGLTALWALASAFHAAGIVTVLPLLFVANVGEEGDGNLRGVRHLYREQLNHAAAIPDSAPAPSIALLIALDGAGTDNIISQALGSRRFEVVISGPAATPGAITERPTPSSPLLSRSLRSSAFHFRSSPAPLSTSDASRVEPPSTPFPSSPPSRSIFALPIPIASMNLSSTSVASSPRPALRPKPTPPTLPATAGPAHRLSPGRASPTPSLSPVSALPENSPTTPIFLPPSAPSMPNSVSAQIFFAPPRTPTSRSRSDSKP